MRPEQSLESTRCRDSLRIDPARSPSLFERPDETEQRTDDSEAQLETRRKQIERSPQQRRHKDPSQQVHAVIPPSRGFGGEEAKHHERCAQDWRAHGNDQEVEQHDDRHEHRLSATKVTETSNGKQRGRHEQHQVQAADGKQVREAEPSK